MHELHVYFYLAFGEIFVNSSKGVPSFVRYAVNRMISYSI